MQPFQDFLRAWLTERGWNYSDLERASGINNSVISRWFADRPRRPSEDNLHKLARVVGHSQEDLMRMVGRLGGPQPEPRSEAQEIAAIAKEMKAELHRDGIPEVLHLEVIRASLRLTALLARTHTGLTPTTITHPAQPTVSEPVRPANRGRHASEGGLTVTEAGPGWHRTVLRDVIGIVADLVHPRLRPATAA